MGQLENLQLSLESNSSTSLSLAKAKSAALEGFLQLCNGSYSIHEIIMTLHRKGLPVNFTELVSTLRNLAKHNIFKNSAHILLLLDYKPGIRPGNDVKVEIKTEDDLIKWLRKVRLFSDLAEPLLKNMVKSSTLKKYKAGDLIIKKGTIGTDAFVLVNGHAGVFTGRPEDLSKPVATIGPMTVFGESAAVDGKPRTADVMSLEDSLVVRIEMSSFIKDDSIKDLKKNIRLRLMVSQVLKLHPLFKTLPAEIMSLMINSCRLERTPAQKTVIQQGDQSQNFYFIMSGECLLIKDRVPEVSLKSGHYFGEMGILTKKARTASVITKTECVLLSIDSENFMSLLANNLALAVVMEGIVQERMGITDEETDILNIDGEITQTLSTFPDAIDLV
ncbi:MAG: cyclic nucleotide-binding domain-containing protein [Bdellovibrionales bacterium]|nr:cyclic nucleotide-binding domain-containing protein [Bdellovibrionales bacterium]